MAMVSPILELVKVDEDESTYIVLSMKNKYTTIEMVILKKDSKFANYSYELFEF